jgi:hypothetical protein
MHYTCLQTRLVGKSKIDLAVLMDLGANIQLVTEVGLGIDFYYLIRDV